VLGRSHCHDAPNACASTAHCLASHALACACTVAFPDVPSAGLCFDGPPANSTPSPLAGGSRKPRVLTRGRREFRPRVPSARQAIVAAITYDRDLRPSASSLPYFKLSPESMRESCVLEGIARQYPHRPLGAWTRDRSCSTSVFCTAFFPRPRPLPENPT